MLEILNDAEFYKEYEIIGGEKFMAPAPNPIHGGVIMRLAMFIGTYFDSKEGCYVFGDNTDIHFPDGTLLKPDLVVILEKNSSIIDWRKGIYGVPDMVAEVLSKSTRKNDLTVKKSIYEAQGVREYWIIDPYIRGISVFLLQDSKYVLDDDYILFDEQEDAKDLELLRNNGQIDQVKHEIPVNILDGLKIPLNYIFKWGYK